MASDRGTAIPIPSGPGGEPSGGQDLTDGGGTGEPCRRECSLPRPAPPVPDRRGLAALVRIDVAGSARTSLASARPLSSARTGAREDFRAMLAEGTLPSRSVMLVSGPPPVRHGGSEVPTWNGRAPEARRPARRRPAGSRPGAPPRDDQTPHSAIGPGLTRTAWMEVITAALAVPPAVEQERQGYDTEREGQGGEDESRARCPAPPTPIRRACRARRARRSPIDCGCWFPASDENSNWAVPIQAMKIASCTKRECRGSREHRANARRPERRARCVSVRARALRLSSYMPRARRRGPAARSPRPWDRPAGGDRR